MDRSIDRSMVVVSEGDSEEMRDEGRYGLMDRWINGCMDG